MQAQQTEIGNNVQRCRCRGRALKNVIKKIKSKLGFTLSETLMTVLILLMVSAVVAEGIPAAVTAFGKAVDAANAQVALSTTVNALRNELSTAWDLKVADDSTSVQFYSSDTGARSRLYKDEDIIMVQDFLQYGSDEPVDGVVPRNLVSEAAVTKNLMVTFSTVSWTDEKKDVLDFKNVTVKKGTTELVSVDDVYIRMLTKSLTIPESVSGT